MNKQYYTYQMPHGYNKGIIKKMIRIKSNNRKGYVEMIEGGVL